jgi:GNAT superfamily N-acetyltransferase
VATPALPAFRTDDRNVELSLEREPKTDERRTANDGPLSILFLSRIVPRDEGGESKRGLSYHAHMDTTATIWRGANSRGTPSASITIRREHRRHGYAAEAITLVLLYSLQELGYQQATVSVYSVNDASAHLQEKLGFQLEGRIRRTIFTDGEHCDELVYGITAAEFTLQSAPPSPAAPTRTSSRRRPSAN